MTQDKLERIVLAHARFALAQYRNDPAVPTYANDLQREMWAYLPDAPDLTTVAGSQAAAHERELQRAIDTINRLT